MLPEAITQLHMWTDTFAALAFIAACVYGYEYFKKHERTVNYQKAVRFVVTLALFPVFWVPYVGAKEAIIAFEPTMYYLGNIMFGLISLLAMYVGLRHLPIPMQSKPKLMLN